MSKIRVVSHVAVSSLLLKMVLLLCCSSGTISKLLVSGGRMPMMRVVAAGAGTRIARRAASSSAAFIGNHIHHDRRRSCHDNHHHHQQQQHRIQKSPFSLLASNYFNNHFRATTTTPPSSTILSSSSSNNNNNSNNNSASSPSITGAAYHATANQQIVHRRNEINRKKREAREKAVEKDRERNLRLRQLFMEEGNNNGDNNGNNNGKNGKNSSTLLFEPAPMFAIKVVTCPELREDLKMTGREKRGRMFVERPAFFDRLYNNDDDDDDDDDINDEDDVEDMACMSLKALKQTIHEFFRRLKKSTYILSASLPTLDQEGNVLPFPEDYSDSDNDEDGGSSSAAAAAATMDGLWRLETDDDVQKAFVQAEQFFLRHQEEQHNNNNSNNNNNNHQSSSSSMKRPTLVLHVIKDPSAPPPPPPPPYLQNLPDPNLSPTMTMLSFYAFPPNGGIPDPESTAEKLKRQWRPFRALGRIYVANEGINAQMAIPTTVLSNFLQCCTLPLEEGGELSQVLGRYMENGMNVDPIPVDMEEFRSNPAFRNLHIRVRSQIVADGLMTPLDWQSAGYDMPPLEWHEKLKEAKELQQKQQQQQQQQKQQQLEEGGGESEIKVDPLPIVLDCRNNYETQVGKFELAEPLDTLNFRDSWDVLKERLRDVPKDAPIMTYCTGGIRCVKVASYLTQELEFTNVSRLAGGIVAYDRTLNEQSPTEEPMFKGVNYVFDGRMGRRITNDQLGTCYTCGSKTHLVSNCNNGNCHRRMVQCENCLTSFLGTCSEGCKGRVLNAGMAPMRSIVGKKASGEGALFVDATKVRAKEDGVVYSNVDDYSSGHSTPQASLLREIESNTATFLASGAHMVSGAMQGSFLTTLASMSREGRILEIGTFTGYATACFLEGAKIAGELLGSECGTREGGGPFVLSLERDTRALGVAAAHMTVMTEFGMGEEGAEAACKLRSDGVEDFEGDSISFTYNNIAGCELRRVSDALATVEEMVSDSPSIPTAPFDIVFVDADKTRLMEYVDVLVSSDRILKKGGLILVDNVLWKGLVLDAASNGTGYESGDDEEDSSSTAKEKEALRKNRRARKLANKMHRFNSAVVNDDRVDVLMMPIRDGLSLVRKR